MYNNMHVLLDCRLEVLERELEQHSKDIATKVIVQVTTFTYNINMYIHVHVIHVVHVLMYTCLT